MLARGDTELLNDDDPAAAEEADVAGTPASDGVCDDAGLNEKRIRGERVPAREGLVGLAPSAAAADDERPALVVDRGL